MKDQKKELLTPDYMKGVQSILNSMITYIEETEDSLKPNLQCLMKNFNYLEYLTMILYWTFKNALVVPLWFEKAPKDLLIILQSSYTLIREIIQEYRPNELYSSQWIDLLFE